MTFFYLTNFSYVKTVLTIWSVSQFAIFKNMHVFADPITYIYIRTDPITLPCSLAAWVIIRECGSTRYVGLARAVPPTNTNFRLTFLLTQLQEALYEDIAV